ncbi:MAG TPA: HNH endonuclease, partial [Acidimicrobiales bacterium]|nr:HNH endonuclease [Acidimicrobiales bacterium]
GCTNVVFTNVHHIKEWKPDRGPTDLDNLVLLCVHHHGLVHSNQWCISGNPNDLLTFVGPSDRALKSLPSPMWTAVTGPAARRANAARRTGGG